MADTAVRANISVTGGPAALTELRAFRQAVADIGTSQSKATLGVDSSALTAAKSDVASLGAAHSALGAKPVALGIDYSQVTSARSAVQGLDGDVGALASSLSKIAAPAALAGIGLGVTKLAADFQTMTTNIRNNTTETDADFAKMNDTIKTLSAESGASLDSLGTGFMHAFNLTGSAAQATTDLSVAMKSAVSTGSDVNATTDALAKTMHQFGIESSGAAATMDTLHTASALGNTTLEQFIGASAKAMVTAASLGVSLSDVSSAYVGLTKSGFDAGEANTQIAALLTHLITPSKQAKDEIATLSHATGVDLVSDFSLAGLQTKGLTGVLTDLRTATGGQEDAILKLIPAQRGGIGALALTTSAYKDVIDAGTQLAAVQSGQLTPTADAYARTQETLGFKIGVLGQQFKQLGIDMGDATIGPVSAVVGALGHIPEGVDKAAVGIGVAALGFKALSTAADLIVAGTAKLGTAIAGDAAAMAEDTAAVTANTAALTANAAARDAASATAGITGVEGYGARAAASQAGTEAVGLAGYEARTAEQVGVGARAAAGGGIADIGAGIGAAAIPVAIPVALGYVIGSQVVDPIFKGIEATKQQVESTKEEMVIQTTIRYAQSADSRTEGRAQLQQDLADARAMFNEVSSLGGGLQDDPATKAALTGYKDKITELQQALTDTGPEHFASQAADEFSKHLTDLSSAVDNNRLTLEQATHFADEYRAQAIATGEGVDQATAAEKAWASALVNSADAAREKLYVDLQTQQTERDRAKQLLDEGAPSQLVETAVFGKGLGVDPGVLLEQQAELASWEKTYAAETQAKKTNDAAQLASAKQRITDEATADKDAAKDRADAQTTYATNSADAWKAANAEIGKIDLSKGLTSLGALGEGIDRVRADLAALGENDAHLDNLTGIIDQFAKITDAENKASVAYQSYMGLLSESDTRIQKLEALKKSYDDAADAALKAQKAGQSLTPDQQQLIASRPAVDANIDAQENRIRTNQAGDLVQAVKVAPDSAGFDDQFRQQIAAQGGAPAVAAKVTVDTAAAESDLAAFEKQDRQTIITIKTNLAEVQGQIDTVAKARTADLTIVTHFVDDQGRPTVSPTIDAARGYGEPQAGTSSAASAQATGTISLADYQKVLSQYPGSPLNNPQALGDINGVASQMGVDPRTLMAIMQTESGYGTTSDKLTPFNNFGGMGVNDRGYGFDSGIHATDGGPEYEGYKDLKSFLMDISAWVKQNGSSFSNYQTADGGQGKNSVMAQLQAQVPLSGPSVNDPTRGYGAGGYNPATINASEHLTTQQSLTQQNDVTAPMSGVSTGSVLATAKSFLGQQYDRVGRAVYGWCEEIVGDIVQTAGGTNYRPDSADQHLKDALAGVPGAGKVISASEAQPGDLVAWPGSDPRAGDSRGHIGVLSDVGANGPDKYIGTTTNGVQERTLPAGAYFIRPDGVVAGGPVPGATMYSGAATGHATTSASSTSGQTDLANPSSPAAQQALAQKNQDAKDLAVSLANVQTAAGQVNRAFAGMNPPQIAAATAEFQRMQPILEKNALAHGGPNGGAAVSEADKQLAVNAAWGQSLEYEAAFAKLVQDATNHTGDLAADTQKVADIVGGPMADGYARAALASAMLAASAATITQLQKDQTAADEVQQKVVQQRQQADTAASRLQTIKGWGQQYLQEQLADKQTAENTSYTGTQRSEQDRQRALQFSQQVQGTDLQNKLTDLQKSQQDATYNRTSQEQLVAASVKSATTNQGAAAAAASLASMHEQDLAQKDLNTKAIDDIQLQIREEAKKASLDSYNLETETIKAQRKHEDIMAGYTAEGTALTRNAAAQQRQDTIAQWRLQDTRIAEDLKYTTEKDANAKAILAQQQIATLAQSGLDTANQALAVFTQTGVVLASQQTALNNAIYQSSVAGMKTASGVPYNQFPAPGQYATGGTNISGIAIVGDTLGGDLSAAEAVDFDTRTVYSHEQSVRMGLLNGGGRRLAAGNAGAMGDAGGAGGIGLSIGNIIVMASDDEETFVRRVQGAMAPQLRELFRQVQRAPKDKARKQGVK